MKSNRIIRLPVYRYKTSRRLIAWDRGLSCGIDLKADYSFAKRKVRRRVRPSALEAISQMIEVIKNKERKEVSYQPIRPDSACSHISAMLSQTDPSRTK